MSRRYWRFGLTLMLGVFMCIICFRFAEIRFAHLTFSQMTNFRLFQSERVCRRQFQISRKRKKVIQTGRKHCRKKEKLLITSNFSFSHSVFKRFVSQGRQKVSLCGNGLTLYQMTNFRLCQSIRRSRRQFQI